MDKINFDSKVHEMSISRVGVNKWLSWNFNNSLKKEVTFSRISTLSNSTVSDWSQNWK